MGENIHSKLLLVHTCLFAIREYRISMLLKSQDVLVVLKLLATGSRKGTFAELGQELGISASEAHAAMKRARRAGLIHPLEDIPLKLAVAEFLLHGLKYVNPVSPGGRTRGIPTGFAAPPLARHFGTSDQDTDILVWPDPEGERAGFEICPLCRSAAFAARQDAALYEWLVLADAMRGAGRARERKLAETIIRERLGQHESG